MCFRKEQPEADHFEYVFRELAVVAIASSSSTRTKWWPFVGVLGDPFDRRVC